LVFKNPANLKDVASEKIKGKAFAWEFRNAVKRFYRNTKGTDITVTRTMKDVDGLVVTNAA
jgi:hypothetical protein